MLRFAQDPIPTHRGATSAIGLAVVASLLALVLIVLGGEPAAPGAVAGAPQAAPAPRPGPAALLIVSIARDA